jgi:iron complex outermembrane receptor protein
MNLKHKFLLSTTMAAGLFFGAPAWAQDTTGQTQPQETDQVETTQPAEEEASDAGDRVVVTGSRIRRTEFTSTQPLQIITAEEATLEGLVDTSEILQSSTVAATAGQINNYFTGFVTVGGPGVNTLSLRGLGAQRTLVLLNGRRAGPAGARGQVGPTDLNVIPSSLIERVEILTDGASSIYGSDAVAGVVNIITRENLDGGFVNGYTNQPFEAGGEELNFSIGQGWRFDQGYLSVSADYYERSPLLFGDRDYFACPQQYLFSADGSQADAIDPDTGQPACNSTGAELVSLYFEGGAEGASDYAPDLNAVAGGGPIGCDMNGWRHIRVFMTGHAYNCWLPASLASAPWQAANTAEYNALLKEYAGRSAIGTHSDRYDSRTAVSPVTRTSITAFAGYDITPTTELFAELLLNRRESEQESWRQWWGVVSALHPRNPFPATMYDPLVDADFAITHVEPTLLINSRNEQKVDYARAVLGLRGSLDFGSGWDWELVGQYSRSDADYGGTFIYEDRILAATQFNTLAQALAGCNTTLLTTATACPTGGMDLFSPAVVGQGALSPVDAAFMLGYETGNTVYEHKYIEGLLTGELFELPAGPVGAAFGFQVREESIDDQPGEQERSGNFWGSSSAVQTVGEDTIKEVFAEFEVPILRDVPLFHELSANLSGRVSEYDTYGDNSTYKVGLNWAVTSDWRLRASQGTSFRAPALYELFLGNLTNFGFAQTSDPCRNWASSTVANPIRDANCAAGRPGEGPLPGAFPTLPTSSAEVTVGGGVGVLEPETADTFSAGLIWTPGFIDFNVAIDYFNIEVNDQVAQFGAAAIVSACYNSENFPNEPLCDLFTRAPGTHPTRPYEILTINDSYVNVARQSNEGIDLTTRYTHDLGFGDLTVNARASYILNWESQLRNASIPTELHDRIGNPEWVANLNARLDMGDWTYFWAANFIPESDNQKFFVSPTATYFGETVTPIRAVDFYQTHDFSARVRFDDLTIQFGIQNVFDEAPNYISASSNATRVGNFPLSSQYDYLGRRGYLSLSYAW